MASGILKCGYLKIKRPPTSGKVRIKAWQSKYFVLRRVPPIVEYFKDELSFNSSRNTKEKNRINLEDVIHIGTTDASKTQRNAFMIVDAVHGALMLAAESEQEKKDWIEALNMVSGKSGSPGESPKIGAFMFPDHEKAQVVLPSQATGSPESGSPSLLNENIQGFPVTTRLTPSSEKLGIRDDYTVYITNEYVALHDVDTNALVVQWPIVGLRGWKSESADAAGRRGTQLLTLEAGRKSATGEGLFQFFTDFGSQIANKIRLRSNALFVSAVEKREKFKEKSSSFEDISPDVAYPKKAKPFVKSSTDPRPVASLMISQQSLYSGKSESDSNIHSQSATSSPQSLREELLQENLCKDIKKTQKVFSEDSSAPSEGVGNTYLDLISDTDAIPIHIADSCHRKSLDSVSLNSDEALHIQKTLLNSLNENNDMQNYIDDRDINVEGKVKVLKQKSVEKSDSGPYSEQLTTKHNGHQGTKQNTHSSNSLCQNFLDQLSNPQTHQANIFQEKHDSSKKENPEALSVSVTKCSPKYVDCYDSESESSARNSDATGATEGSSEKVSSSLDQSCDDEPPSMRKPRSESSSEKRVFPHGKEEAKDLLDKLVLNLEAPQTCAQERIFPPRKEEKLDRNTSLKSEDENSQQTNLPRSEFKKTIEKSKSHCGFDSKQHTEKPPPLPVRPEMASHARTKPSASMGDITKDLSRPIDFHKDLHRQFSPWNATPALGAPWGPESVLHARLLHHSTSGTSLVAVREAHQSLRNTDRTSSPVLDKTRSQLVRGASEPHNKENERFDDEFKKRRGSKASTFISRVLSTLNPADSKRRASCDIVSSGPNKELDSTKRGRSCSVVPGGIINEGWSPEQSIDDISPEGSPLNIRRVLPGARRLSHDPNLDRTRKPFIGSPTFERRSKEEMRQREKARERERERSELPNEPPPQLPPRKKSDPPPLPPRIRKSSSDSCCSVPSSPRVKLHEQLSDNNCDEIVPPPIPPRRDDRRGSHPAPSIQLTTSSPDERTIESMVAGMTEAAETQTSCGSTSDDSTQRTPKDSCQSRSVQHQATHIKSIKMNTVVKTNSVVTEHCFVSIEMQERAERTANTGDDRLELSDIEHDSVDGTSTTHTSGNNPGHTSPLAKGLPSRNGGIVLGDSPTTPISV